MLLAAGRGSRLKERTEHRPKCLVEVAGKSLLQWQTEALHAAGLVDVAVVRGYRREALCDPGYTYFDNERWAETNMVGSLLCAAQWLVGEACVISYSDLLYPPAVVEKIMAASGDIVIAYDPHWLTLWSGRFAEPLSDAETFDLNERGELVEIGHRAADVAEIKGQYMGLLKLTPSGWQTIERLLATCQPEEVDRLDMTALLYRLLQEGETIHTVSIEDEWWFEIDSSRDIDWAEQNLGRLSQTKT